MTPLEFLSINKFSIQEYNLLEEAGIEYWHTNILDNNGISYSSGFGSDKNYSRKVAYSEFLERYKFKEIKSSTDLIRNQWGLNLIQTGCGFAAGFNEVNTVKRSIGEAIERWALSKWIDDNYRMEKNESVGILKQLDPISRWFFSQFDNVLFFEKEVLIFINNVPMTFLICATVGIKNDGVYLGSSAQYQNGLKWQHALLESFRHYLLVKNSKETGIFPDNRVRFFSKNAKIAFEQIEKNKKNNWPIPDICFHKVAYFQDLNYFLARTIIKGWSSWSHGPVERFLY